MPTNRRHRAPSSRPLLSAGLVHVLYHGSIPDETEVATAPQLEWWWACNAPGRWWREVGDELLAEWIRAHPGTRPWAWWKLEAPEARTVLEGAARLRPVVNPGDWAWHWRENHGTPAYHPGLVPFVIESEAAFLRRHGLLDPEEAARVPTDDWKPELIDEGDAAA